MKITEILNEKTTDLNMECTCKEEAISHLSNLLLEAGYITETFEFEKDIFEREALGITGIGNGIATPHGKSDVVKRNGIAIGRCNHGIPWESLDNEDVKLIILFCVGNDNNYADNHLKMLAEVARKLGNDKAVENLIQATNYEEILSVFEE